MSFGNLNGMVSVASEIIKKANKIITFEDLTSLKNQVYNECIKKYDDTSLEKIDEIFNRILSINYVYNKLTHTNGKNSFREFEEGYPDIMVPDKYKPIEAQFNKLKLLPQPAQRSQEWYDYRYNRITASDTASAIDLNPYEPVESFILKKCDPNFPFRDNDNVYHGKKYEPVATMIYEHIYNTRVYEFGALPSEKYKILGASPDGICSKYTLDNMFSERLGTMLEIKCPVTREITTSGKSMGEICPYYYYCQVQQQLLCCELDVCDFWQCRLSEYANRNEYLADISGSKNSIGNNAEKVEIDSRLNKGIIIEFYPKIFKPEFDGDNIRWKSKYIYPKRMDMDTMQYDMWVLKIMNEYKTLYPEIDKDYYFNNIIYWKLEITHNLPIKRDDKFMETILPVLEETWKKIVYYRKNLDKLPELQAIVDKRKKYTKFNTSYTIHNDMIINNKILFLDDKFNSKTLITEKVKNVYKKKTDNSCSFIEDSNVKVKKLKILTQNLEDNNDCDFVD
jgi:putative phage-type endonuclease